MGTTRIFTATLNANAVPTACAGGTCMKRIRTGAVITPAPTPVTPMATAIINPSTISIGLFALNVDAALQLMAAPAAGARVVGIQRRRGARRATYAGVALIV